MAVRLVVFVAGLLILGAECRVSRSELSPVRSVSVVVDDRASQLETLQQAWAIALAIDQRLEAKRRELSSTTDSLHSARARRWPNLTADTSYTVCDNERAFRFADAGFPVSVDTLPFRQSESFAFRMDARVPLYTGGRIGHGVAASESEVRAARSALVGSKSDLKLLVAEEYVAVLRAQRGVQVARSTLKSLQSHARDVEMLFAHQQVPRNDVLAARVELLNAGQQTIRARSALDAGRAAYNRRLGRPLAAEVRIAELPVENLPEDVDSLTRRALQSRSELAHLGARIRALRHRESSVRAKDRPQVELLGQYDFEENRFQSPNGITSVGVGVHWNLFDAGRNRHKAAAISQRAGAVARIKADSESMVALEVRLAWLDVRETRQRIAVAMEAIKQAEENLRIARKRYASGVGTNTEVLDAETLRTRAYRDHNNAIYDAALATIRLRHATGQL